MAAEGLADPVGYANGDAQRLFLSYSAALQPLVSVGVTGHRDVADPQQACRSVTAALCRVLTMLETAKWPVGVVRSAAPAATALGYRIVSPLAEGADRIAADLVLNCDTRLSHRTRELVVPLPFGLDYYRGRDGQPGSDCSSPQSQAEFDRLQSAALWTRPLHPHGPADQAQRNAWYRDVGKYVVEHCDLLFALWDGQDTAQDAGTAAIVRLALKRGTPVIWIPVTRQTPSAPAGPAPDDAVPRILVVSAAGQADLSAALDLSSPSAQTALTGRRRARRLPQEFLLERLARLEEVCRYARKSGRVQREIATEMRVATASARSAGHMLESLVDWIIPAYVATDGLALRYQRRLKALNIGVYTAAAAAVALGAFAAILVPYGGNWRLPVVFEAIVLVLLLVVQWQDLRKKYRDRWVTYRAMGEYLRIGCFLALVTPKTASGLEFARFARLYSWSSEPSTVPWFAPVIGRVWDRRPDLDVPAVGVVWLRDYLIVGWIDRQISYHEDRRDDHLRWDKRLYWIIRAILLVTVVIVLLHVLLDYFPHLLVAHHAGRDTFLKSLSFIAIALTSVAAAFNGYSGQQRHYYHYMRFHRMTEELRGIRSSVGNATTMEQLGMHISEVRRVTLGETTDWYEEMQEQVIDSPS
jgi:hypothetical protein